MKLLLPIFLLLMVLPATSEQQIDPNNPRPTVPTSQPEGQVVNPVTVIDALAKDVIKAVDPEDTSTTSNEKPEQAQNDTQNNQQPETSNKNSSEENIFAEEPLHNDTQTPPSSKGTVTNNYYHKYHENLAYQCECMEVDLIFNDRRGKVWVFATSYREAEIKALSLCARKQKSYEDDMRVLYCNKHNRHKGLKHSTNIEKQKPF